jgi:hypothetical protein
MAQLPYIPKIRILVLGDSGNDLLPRAIFTVTLLLPVCAGVGKTSLVHHMCNNAPLTTVSSHLVPIVR